jgi:hypothetical protein
MQKTLLLFALCSSILRAQITVNKIDFADGGDTVRMSLSNDLNINYASTGNNYNWDFSTLSPSAQKLKNFRSTSQLSLLSNFLFGTFAPTPYKASYFTETTDLPIEQLTSFLPITVTDIFQYARATTDSITNVGYSMMLNGTEIPFQSDTIEKMYDLPLEFGNNSHSSGYTNMDLNPAFNAIWRQYRTRDSEVDGWGTITTPYGFFQVLRMRHEIQEIDSIYYGDLGIWIPVVLPTSYLYEWWANGQLEPILRIKTALVDSSENVTNIEYRDVYRGMDAGLDEPNREYSLFPNPSSTQIQLTTQNNIDGLDIIDPNGKIMRKETFEPTQKMKISISDLSPGRYNLVLYYAGNSSTITFLKE